MSVPSTKSSVTCERQTNTEVAALAAEESEKLVTRPIELEMAGLPGLREMRSLTNDRRSDQVPIAARCPPTAILMGERPTAHGRGLQRSNSQITELDPRSEMVVLQTDVALRQSIRIHELADLLPVEDHGDRVPLCGDLIAVPLSHRLRCQCCRGREFLHRSGHVERIAKRVRRHIRVLSRIVDLNLVSLVRRRLPVVSRIGIAKRRNADEHAGIVVGE